MKRLSRSDSQSHDAKFGRIGANRVGARLRLVILLAGLSLVIPIAHAGKPVPPPPPPPPPVHYQLTYLDNLGADCDTEALEMNDLGIIVGTATNTVTGVSRAVMWLPTGAIFDLNTSATWNEPGWTATEASSVNAVNQIVGRATKTGSPDRAFIYDMATATFVLLPQVAGQTTVGRVDINDHGTVAAQVVGSISGGVVYAPPLFEPVEILGGAWIRINNMGTITVQSGAVMYPPYSLNQVVDLGASGYRIWGLADNSDVISGLLLGQKGKNAVPAGPVRRDLTTGSQLLLPSSSGYTAHDMNDHNDMVIWNVNGYRDGVYKDGVGVLALDNLVVSENPQWLAAWLQAEQVGAFSLTNPSDITDPESTGFGAICGVTYEGVYPFIGGKRAFVLLPQAP